MNLSVGSRLGPYEIVAAIGRGGMGEVWRAHDTRLSRDVALKALPEEFARDADRRARFDREARVLAALNHPNITTLFGIEERDGSSYLVLELVEGRSLEARLEAGPLTLDDALAIVGQIAAGLEAAHSAGIVHRDLKPANVQIRPDGSVKILDLGLAKAAAAPSAPEAGTQASMTMGATHPGMILGTAAYMSPEQARGQTVDHRTDIFAFGCVLYECLAGRRPFCGELISDLLVAVITSEPDWSALPPGTPPPLADLVRRCLRKDALRRLQAIGDARIAIEEIAIGTQSSVPPSAPVKPASSISAAWRLAAVFTLLGLAGGLLVDRLVSRTTPTLDPGPSLRAVLPLPNGVSLSTGNGQQTVAISPDGRTIVFRGLEKGAARLYRRVVDSDESVPIPGTEGGLDPFFSPDGQWLGFFAGARIKKVATAGGAPLPVCEVSPVASGGTWSDDGWIVFSRGPNAALSRVSPSGGSIEPLTELDAAGGEHAHVWPQALPAGRMLLTAVRGRDFQDLDSAQAVVLSPGGKPRVVLEGASFARIVPGWIVFVRGTAVLAAPFDLDRLEVTGPPISVPQPIAIDPFRRTTFFAVSSDGTLVFEAGPPLPGPQTNIVRADRAGAVVVLPLAPAIYQMPRLSPDGSRLAVSRYDGMAGRVFVFEFDRQVFTTLTPEPGRAFGPVWSPDGSRIAYASFGAGEPRALVKSADGSSAPAVLTEPRDDAFFPNSWFPGGQEIASVVAYADARGGTRLRGTSDIWILPLDRQNPPQPWFETPARELAPVVSPDGRAIAYVSDVSGRSEVYLRVYPGPGSTIQVSNNGGTEPAWSRAGREIIYREGDRFMSVDVRSTPEMGVASPRVLFTAPYLRGSREDIPRQYDVSGDGNLFIALQPVAREPVARQLGVVTHWTRTLVPPDRR